MSLREALEESTNLLSKIQKHILPLQEEQQWNDEEFFNDARLAAVKNSQQCVTEAVAYALTRLGASRPKEILVQELIRAFPDALKHRIDGKLPIQCLLHAKEKKCGSQYIFILAMEGMNHGVGGANMRGGILCSSNWENILQQLCSHGNDVFILDVLKRLHEKGLLRKEDICEFHLLYYACRGKDSSLRFEYFMELDPEALDNTRYGDMSLIHAPLTYHSDREDYFKNCLKYSMKFQKDLLFQKNGPLTAFKRASKRFDVMHILREEFLERDGYPLLHKVILHEPNYFNQFVESFPWAIHLRDENGRTITQLLLSSSAGREILEKNPLSYMRLNVVEIEAKDPLTTLKPFAAVASGNDGKLNISFQLLRQNPTVLDEFISNPYVTAKLNKRSHKSANQEQGKEKSCRKKLRGRNLFDVE